MTVYQGDGFSIEARWKEEVIYAEGDNSHLFGAAWGVHPPLVVVPRAEFWDEVMPGWLRGRRDEVLARLVEHSGHVIDDSDGRSYWRS